MKQPKDRLKELIEDSGLKSAEFCRQADVPPANWSRYLNGERLPKGNFLVKIARFFGVTTDWILTGEGEQKTKIWIDNAPSSSVISKKASPKSLEDFQMQKDLIDALKRENALLREKIERLEGSVADQEKKKGNSERG